VRLFGLKIWSFLAMVPLCIKQEIQSYSLHEVNQKMNAKPGKTIQLEVERGGSNLKFAFELKKVL